MEWPYPGDDTPHVLTMFGRPSDWDAAEAMCRNLIAENRLTGAAYKDPVKQLTVLLSEGWSGL